MLQKIFIIAFIVWAIYETMQEDMVFGKLGDFFAIKIKSEYWRKPVFDCAICMCGLHGTYVYWLIFGLWKHSATWQENIVVCIGAMGVNTVLSKLFPEKMDDLQKKIDEIAT